MGSNLILCDREDIRSVEAKEQLSFVFYVLESMGVPEEEILICKPENGVLTVKQKSMLRDLCEHYNVTLLDDMDGGLKIYVEVTLEDGQTRRQTLVAEWKKPWFVLKADTAALGRSKRYYAEIHTSWWSMQEEQDG